MLRKGIALAMLILACGSAPRAQQEIDPIDYYTFAPELIMQHQGEIQLSAGQAEAIKREAMDAQARFTGLEWDLQTRMEAFLTLLAEERVDEERALAQLQRVLELETAIKQLHLTLAIRIKNQLTPEQQVKLRELREHR